MHRLMILMAMTGSLFSCGGVFKKDVRGFIEGSYVRNFATEFAVGVDSVVLQPQGKDQYLITRYSRFARINNGAAGEEELREEKMTGRYDAEQQVIHEGKKGKVISFAPEKQMMMMGASEFRKVK